MRNDYQAAGAIINMVLIQIKNGQISEVLRLIKMIKDPRVNGLTFLMDKISKEGSILMYSELVTLMGYHKATAYCFCRHLIHEFPEILDDINFLLLVEDELQSY